MAKHFKKGPVGKSRVLVFALFLLIVVAIVYSVGGGSDAPKTEVAEEPDAAKTVTAVSADVVKSADVSADKKAQAARVVSSADAVAAVSQDKAKKKPQSVAKQPKAKKPVQTPAQPVRKRKPGAPLPLMAIIIDDGGEQMEFAQRVAALNLPMTWAIMPYRRYSQDNADLARSKNIPYLLHLPMQAISDKDGSQSIIAKGMSQSAVRQKTAEALNSLPGVVGINNHRGSLATSNAKLMEPIMKELKQRGLIFVDSRTSSESVAYQTAVAAGVPALKNRAFLDNVADKNAVRARFFEAARNAERTSGMVAICHFRPATVAFLEELNKQRASLPVKLITIPEMVRATKGQ